jgi:hypothetical protein
LPWETMRMQFMPRQPIPRARFEGRTSRIENRIAAHSAVMSSLQSLGNSRGLCLTSFVFQTNANVKRIAF